MAVISDFQAFILGLVEGITEFLPVSSTGHLVVTSELLGLRGHVERTPEQIAAIQAFEIVIQAGAILAVVFIYRTAIQELIAGLLGKSEKGRKLLINIIIASFPALGLGYLLKDFISEHLQFTGPVLASMALGGIVMIVFEKYILRRTPADESSLYDMTPKQALFIGCMQCFALWPGTSRSMVTILGSMLAGFRRPLAAEFSFLVGLPTLLAATGYKGLKDGSILLEHVGASALGIGLVTSAIFAFVAVKWLVSFLNKRGLAVFGWYRLAAAVAIYYIVGF